ncbi:MAG: 30S ribosome-binding factor RbfA [Saprospiraceae bacterium]|nr:30S ribosome-binding factor RbfA [Saprospiraceae bacterium]
METKRQKQIAELIKRQISMILLQEGSYIYGNSVLVTVTQVKLTPDFNIAKIYLSIFNTENKQEVILELQEANTRLRHNLASKMKHQMRRIPDLQYYIDDTIDEMYHVDQLLAKLEAEGQMGPKDVPGEDNKDK